MPGVPDVFVEIDTEQGGRGVEARIEGAQNRAEDHCREKPESPRGYDFDNQPAVGEVAFLESTGKQMPGDDARQHQIKRPEQFHERREENAFLPFGETPRTEGPLHDRLVGAPVIGRDEQHSGKQGGKRDVGFFVECHRVEFFRFVLEQIPKPAGDAAAVGQFIAEQPEAQNRNRQPADQKTDPVEGIGHRDRFEPAENRVDRPDNSETDDGRPECGGLIATEQLRHVEHVTHEDRPRIENKGQQIGQKRQQQQNRNQGPDPSAESVAEELRHRPDSALQVAGQKHQSHQHNGDRRPDFPGHHLHAVGVAAAVQAHELLGRKVGQQERSGDHDPGSRSVRQGNIPVDDSWSSLRVNFQVTSPTRPVKIRKVIRVMEPRSVNEIPSFGEARNGQIWGSFRLFPAAGSSEVPGAIRSSQTYSR